MPRTDELKKWIIKEDVQIEHSHYLKLLKGTIVIAKDRPILLDELGLEIPEKLYWQLVEELDNEDITLDDLNGTSAVDRFSSAKFAGLSTTYEAVLSHATAADGISADTNGQGYVVYKVEISGFQEAGIYSNTIFIFYVPVAIK